MTEETVHPAEDLAGYALGALEGSEASALRPTSRHARRARPPSRIPGSPHAGDGLDPVSAPPEAWAAIRIGGTRDVCRGQCAGVGCSPSGAGDVAVLTTLARRADLERVAARELTRAAMGAPAGVYALSAAPADSFPAGPPPGARRRLFVAWRAADISHQCSPPLRRPHLPALVHPNGRVHHGDRRHLQGRLTRPGVGQGHCPRQSRRGRRHCGDRGAGSRKREPDGSSPPGS